MQDHFADRQPMRVLVTGGAGFIGSELVSQLVARGDRVTVVDTLVNGRRENIAHLPEALCRLATVDIRDRAALEPLLDGVDIVFHLACLGVRHSLHDPRENHEVNAGGTLTLLEASQAARVGRFVYVSSSEVYGTAITVPMSEMHPTFPMTVYGGGKLAGESYARAYFESFGFPTVMVRPFNAFGPRCHHEGDSGEVIPKFMLRAMAGQPMIIFGDGTQTRDFTFVADTARGILAAGLHPLAVGETINLGQGAEITVNALAREVARVVGRPDAAIVHDAPRPGDVLRLFADSHRAERLLGYRPTVSLKAGLERLYLWYREHQVPVEQMLAAERPHNWMLEAAR